MFYDNFGLTVSGELMLSTNSPIKLGTWTFPSTVPPSFTDFRISRAKVPSMPGEHEFEALMSSGWKNVVPTGYGEQ